VNVDHDWDSTRTPILADMEDAASVLSKEERLMLLRLLQKLGKAGKEES
jgi:hypothetical protein